LELKAKAASGFTSTTSRILGQLRYQASSTILDMPLLSNVPALRLTLAYAIHDPSCLLPHRTIPTLLSLPLPVGPSLPSVDASGKHPTIRALVLDKDNTLCPPETAKLHQAYINKLEKIRDSEEFSHNRHSILIVSNTAGSSPTTEHEAEAKQLELELGLSVLRQQPGLKKPLCGPEILKYFRDHGVTTDPKEIVVVGDRLATDVLVAREMGSWSVWCKNGWRNPETQGRDYRGFFSKMEARFERIMRGGFGKAAPLPKDTRDQHEV
jgi:phosphatidylglycerophosphatase GEP4